MLRMFLLFLALSACGMAPQKSLSPSGFRSFETALVETGNTKVARSVAHIVDTGEQLGLVVYVRRNDGRIASVSRAQVGRRDVPFERVSIADDITGTLIPHSKDELVRAAEHGLDLTLCGSLGCYPVNVPATLYQQALLE